MTDDRRRTDDRGRAFAGSQLQIQIYVNRRASDLDRAILAAVPDLQDRQAQIRWVPYAGEVLLPARQRSEILASG